MDFSCAWDFEYSSSCLRNFLKPTEYAVRFNVAILTLTPAVVSYAVEGALLQETVTISEVCWVRNRTVALRQN